MTSEEVTQYLSEITQENKDRESQSKQFEPQVIIEEVDLNEAPFDETIQIYDKEDGLV